MKVNMEQKTENNFICLWRIVVAGWEETGLQDFVEHCGTIWVFKLWSYIIFKEMFIYIYNDRNSRTHH